MGWALVAGGLLGLCALIQVQLLLPIPVALAVLAVARAWRDRDRWMAAIGALVITGAVTLLLVGPWLVWLAGVIAKNGGFSIDSSADLLPVRIGFWDYPIQFGSDPAAGDHRRRGRPAVPAPTRRPAIRTASPAAGRRARPKAASSWSPGGSSRGPWRSSTSRAGRSRTPSGRNASG